MAGAGGALSGNDEVAKQLYAFCSNGDHRGLSALLDKEPYALRLLDMTNNTEPPKAVVEKTIYTACLKGHAHVVKELLRAKVNPNANCGLGTPIYGAAKSGNLAIVKLLIEYGAQYKRVRSGFSPLFVSCIEGRIHILRYLVNIGADLFAFTNPPLIFTACMQGHLDIVQYLMEEMEFNIHRTISGEDAVRVDGKDSLLYVACSRKKIDVAEFLVQKGAILTHTIVSKFQGVVKVLLDHRIRVGKRPSKPGMPPPSMTARWKELGLAEVPWMFLSGVATKITKLELRSNRLNCLPEEIFKMPSLKTLDVSQNNLPDLSQEDVVWECNSLQELDASRNQLAFLPSSLFQMSELIYINLSYNLLRCLPGDIDDACPDAIWTCEKLKRLDLSHNRIRSLPEHFDNLRRLNTLNIAYNYLQELPVSLSWGCINLIHMDASHNSLQGLPIGASTYWMHSLERLYLSHNELTEISRDITELSHLNTLDLSYNRIEYLPLSSWWANARMNKLSLAHNQLIRLTHESEEEQTYTRAGSNAKAAKNSERPPRRGIVNTLMRGRVNKETVTQRRPEQEAPDNEPRELPVDKWSATLQSLLLQNNNIHFLPNYLGGLTVLARLDISNNTSIHCLPLSFGRLKNCWELIMNGLDITNVPRHLLPGMSRGASTKQLVAYLKAQLKNSKPYTRMKLMAVGLQGRGKTTLLSVLRNPNASLPENVSTVGINVSEWVVHPPKAKNLSPRHQLDVVFSTWDLAGQEVYYATHQCFLSRNTLYLVVWNMEEGEKGINFLRPWLLNVQARAPYSPVLIVGTHLDRLNPQKASELRHHFRQRILKLYDKDGYPRISDIRMVSCVTREGIRELQERIHYAAVEAKDPDTREYVIGMQVPASYIELQRLIQEEVKHCTDNDIPPVLNQKEFTVIAEKTGDISDPEELSLAAQFLHDNGVVLHYNDHLKGLNNLYFINPVWLADMLAHIITVKEKQSFIQNGILREEHVKIIFHGNKNFPEQFLSQYMQLLERFEIALSLGEGSLLVPSMLPVERPALPFALPIHRPRVGSATVDKMIPKRNILALTHSPPSVEEDEEEEDLNGEPPITKMIEGREVVAIPVTRVMRRYKLAYIPSGFWSRLISRLMINLKRSGLLVGRQQRAAQDLSMIYWRKGILVVHSQGKFLVESIQCAPTEITLGDAGLEASAKFVGDVLDRSVQQGVDITVWSSNEDFSAMGYVVDQIDSLIDEWFPGLNDLDVEGDWLVQRQALWVPPKELQESLDPSVSHSSSDWSFSHSDGQQQQVYTFRLEECALVGLLNSSILCSDYNIFVPLSHLVPDLLLTDLPPHLMVDQSQLQFNPKDASSRLGRGGAGAVYRGKYKNESIAVKEFLTQSQSETMYETDEAPAAYDPHDDTITSGEALFLFRDLRQEVTVLAQLSHPNIMSLLGVSLRPMCLVMELAPMGSLFSILDHKLEAIKTAHADLPSANLRMPGGVLGHEISARIALQVALALRYLHTIGIVYRDLKSDNVLIWSLDVDTSVNAKLADYGISRFANPGGIKGEEGTPGYMAPEAIRRRGEDQAFDEKVDIFSFGMLLFELMTGQRPFESLTSGQEVNRAVLQRDRPQIYEANAEPTYPSMMYLMEDCWAHLAADRPSGDEVVQRVSAPGFLCCRHTITRVKEHPIQKIDTIFARPVEEGEVDTSMCLWTWSRQDLERNFSILDVEKGVFNLPEKLSPGGRVYAMAATGEVHKRIWIATAVSRNHPDNEIQVYGYKAVGDPQCLWSFQIRDTALELATEVVEGRVKRVFASLANGNLMIFIRKSVSPSLPSKVGDAEVDKEACVIRCDDPAYRAEANDWADPLVLQLSEGMRTGAIKCMTFVGKDRLWCGCSNNICVVDSINLKVLHTFTVFIRRNQLINKLVSDGKKVWGIGRGLSKVMEWDAKTYKLLLVFDCSQVEPTGSSLVAEPRTVPDILIAEPESKDRKAEVTEEPCPSPPKSDGGEDGSSDSTEKLSIEGSMSPVMGTSPKKVQSGFHVTNEPLDPSRTRNAPFSSRNTRKTLRDVNRPRSYNMSKKKDTSLFAPRPEESARQRAREHFHLRQQGATRITDLLVVDQSLWIARGMGDVLIVNIHEGSVHGRVLGRLAGDDVNKYGNRSHQRLALVGGRYVASAQWMEEIRPRAGTTPTAIPGTIPQDGNLPRSGTIFQEPAVPSSHQQIMIWEAWSYKKIEQYTRKVEEMMEMDRRSSTGT